MDCQLKLEIFASDVICSDSYGHVPPEVLSWNFGYKNYLSAVYFSLIFGHYLLYWEFKDKYSQKPVSVTRKNILTPVINSLTPVYGSTAQDLAAKTHQKCPLLDHSLIFMTQR